MRGDILFFLKWVGSSYIRELILGEEVELVKFRESFCVSRKMSDMREIGKLMGSGDIVKWVSSQMRWSGSVEDMERRKVSDIVSWLRRSDLAGVFETDTWDRYIQEYHMIQACF